MKMIFRLLLILIISALTFSCAEKKIQSNSEEKADSLLALMTLREKIGQLTLYTSDWDVTGPTMRKGYQNDIKNGDVGAIFNAIGSAYTRQLQELAVENTRLKIPLLFGYDVIHGHRTIFPIPLAESCSWDLELMQRSARIAAEEATAEGLHWTFAPMVDIARDPRWGRVMEGAGEDTYLGSQIAAARVKGFQGENLNDINTMLACVKHFAAYGAAQAGRDYHTVDMSDRVLRETYLPPYKAALDAGAATVMTSFNEIHGEPASGSQYLLTDILRKEWGFDGFVVTDYTSIMEMLYHGVVADTTAAAALAINAGVDMDMQAGFFQDKLEQLVKEGKVSEARINEAAKRILKLKFDLGLFDDPYKYCDTAREKAVVMNEKFLIEAKENAKRSIVLLKNQDKVLPINKNIKTLAVVGPMAHARKDLIGSWSAAGDWKKAVTLLEGIQQTVSPSTKVLYAKGSPLMADSTQYFADAIAKAKQAEAIVLAVGEASWMSGEAASRTNIQLPLIQKKLMEEILKLNKPTVLIVMNGRPLDLSFEDKHFKAILETWFLGTQAGPAIAEVLFGDYNPSGKLTMTFPRSLGQVPIYYSMKNTGRPYESDPNNKYVSKYIDESNYPLYPFGHGLSYTSFSYTKPFLDKTVISPKDTLTVTCTITNIGDRPGEEIVQLYLRDLVGSVTRPIKELKGFKKVNLAVGESKVVSFKVTVEDLKFYTKEMKFSYEPGDFEVFVGGDSNTQNKILFSLKTD
ncbi:MAG: beta-glucosidase BglX [Cyclobacteriaceae bacterium]|nr:beta-glucosidase BglX [Cyclobacteriaceae bacterium]